MRQKWISNLNLLYVSWNLCACSLYFHNRLSNSFDFAHCWFDFPLQFLISFCNSHIILFCVAGFSFYISYCCYHPLIRWCYQCFDLRNQIITLASWVIENIFIILFLFLVLCVCMCVRVLFAMIDLSKWSIWIPMLNYNVCFCFCVCDLCVCCMCVHVLCAKIDLNNWRIWIPIFLFLCFCFHTDTVIR